MNEQFKQDTLSGLTSNPKSLPSKYFYDAVGDDLFIQIMNMPEYYLTNCELEIFRNKTNDLITNLGVEMNKPFDLIELGAGDGTKTIHLLEKLQKQGYDFEYHPVDISHHSLDGLSSRLHSKIPTIKIVKQQGDYFNILSKLQNSGRQKIILFLGSNIGNFNDEKAKEFIKSASDFMMSGDRILIGCDPKKPKEIVLPAYNDKAGITAKFNLNLLTRINKEFQADFDTSKFSHLATYSDNEGIARSFIVSKKAQTVHIKALELIIDFEKDERIHTEISRKYSDKILNDIIIDSNLGITGKIQDSRNYFADYILKKTNSSNTK